MFVLVIFLFMLLLTFGVVMVLTRPSQSEQAVQARLQAAAIRYTAESQDNIDILKRENYSEIPWLNGLFARLRPTARLRHLIAEAAVPWTVGRLVLGSVLAAVVCYSLGRAFALSPIITPLLGFIAAIAPYLYLVVMKSRRRRKFSTLLPDAMDLISRALRAGHSLTAALDLVAQEIPDPVGPEFRRIFEEQNLGLPLRDALLNLTERVPIPDVQFLVASMLIQRETGGNLVEVLDKTAALLRDRMRLQGQIRVHTAQGRLTGWILCLLPIASFFALSLVNPNYMKTLTSDSLGQILMVVGACLMMLGMLVIRKIVNVKV